MRGPTFARVFDTPGFFYSERFKHMIGPEITWTYRTRVDDFNSIPKFDGNDHFLGTNQIDYALVQRFFAKRRGPTGKSQPYEFLTWRLGRPTTCRSPTARTSSTRTTRRPPSAPEAGPSTSRRCCRASGCGRRPMCPPTSTSSTT